MFFSQILEFEAHKFQQILMNFFPFIPAINPFAKLFCVEHNQRIVDCGDSSEIMGLLNMNK